MTPAYLDSRLVTRRGIIIARSDTLRRRGPQPPTLPFALLLNRLYLHLLLWHRRVREHFTRFGDRANRRPLALVRADRLAALGQDGLVRVGLAGDPAFALVFNRGEVARVADDGGRVGELDVRRAPDEALDLKSGWRGGCVKRNQAWSNETYGG